MQPDRIDPHAGMRIHLHRMPSCIGPHLLLSGRRVTLRVVTLRPPVTRLDAGDDPLRIEVKFVDGLRFDVNPGGVLKERPQQGLESARSRRLLAQIISNGGRWHRMAALPEEELNKKHQKAQWNLGKEIADLNS